MGRDGDRIFVQLYGANLTIFEDLVLLSIAHQFLQSVVKCHKAPVTCANNHDVSVLKLNERVCEDAANEVCILKLGNLVGLETISGFHTFSINIKHVFCEQALATQHVENQQVIV